MALNKINWFRHIIGLIGFGTLFAIGSLAHYLGAFKSVEISEGIRGPFYVLYQEHRGPYHKIVTVIENVEKWAKEQKLSCEWTYGEYLDNPDVVEESRLRSHGGCLFPKAPPLTSSLPENFKLEAVESRYYVVAEFQGSPGIGPLKVYPRLEDYLIEHKLTKDGPIWEVYKIEDSLKNKMTTTYLLPVLSK